MKVCFLAHLNDMSGANRSLVDLVSGLAKQGHEVTVIVPRRGLLSTELKKRGINSKVILSATWAGKKTETKIKRLMKKLFNHFAEYRVYYYIRNNNFDIIHYNSSTYGVGATLLKKNHIDYYWHIREYAESGFGLFFYNKDKTVDCIRNSKTIIVISKDMKKEFGEKYDNVKLVYNGIDLEKNHYMKDRKFNTPVFLMVGAISEDKGQLVAVKALRELIGRGNRNAEVHFVGSISSTEYMHKIKAYIESNNLGEHVNFKGYMNDVADIRRNYDYVLVCSSREAFGRVTIEAMYSGEVVIGANSGATSELIEHNKTGVLYEVDDYLDLCNKMEWVLLNREEAVAISQEAHEYAKNNFSESKVIDNVLNLYRQGN